MFYVNLYVKKVSMFPSSLIVVSNRRIE